MYVQFSVHSQDLYYSESAPVCQVNVNISTCAQELIITDHPKAEQRRRQYLKY